MFPDAWPGLKLDRVLTVYLRTVESHRPLAGRLKKAMICMVFKKAAAAATRRFSPHLQRRWTASWIVLGAVLMLTVLPTPAANPANPVADLLRSKIEQRRQRHAFVCQGEILCGLAVIPAFYARRHYLPAWSHAGRVRPAAGELLKVLEQASQEGLRPADYHLHKIKALLADLESLPPGASPPPAAWADLDLLLTDSFLLYAAHLTAGRVNPETYDPQWLAFSPSIDLGTTLSAALQSGSIAAGLRQLAPPQPGYTRLRKALQHYRRLAAIGGWPTLPAGTRLGRNDCDARVLLLRRRLASSGDLAPGRADPANECFDAPLESALIAYQQRNHLKPDGILGPDTLRALNVPLKNRIRQIVINLERWRWTPRDLGRRHILVDIADFHLELVERGQALLGMRIVVGRSYRRTPVFSSKIKYLVFNPYWNVPRRLASKDILPKVLADPLYLQKQGIRIFENWRADAREIDAHTIDWKRLKGHRFPYRMRQDPGPQNALGRIKFMFPNRFSVYLHDTPHRELFAHFQRDFSSGCIRVQRPVTLAVELLKYNAGWDRAKINACLASGQRRVVVLKKPIRIHLLYRTAWVDTSAKLHFRPDIYGRDRLLEKALLAKPPAG